MNGLRIPVAIVHHANQYLITNGYRNRAGINEIIGRPDASSGLRAVLELHSLYGIPLHLHVSGTLIEACAWFEPVSLKKLPSYTNMDYWK
jgi:starch synthase